MPTPVEYAALLIFAACSAGVGLLLLFASRLFGPRHPTPIKQEPFECGMTPIALPAGRLPVHFYVAAMLFVVFDVELVFLSPWAVLARELGWAGLADMGAFLLVVVAGFVYAWRHRALSFR